MGKTIQDVYEKLDRLDDGLLTKAQVKLFIDVAYLTGKIEQAEENILAISNA